MTARQDGYAAGARALDRHSGDWRRWPAIDVSVEVVNAALREIVSPERLTAIMRDLAQEGADAFDAHECDDPKNCTFVPDVYADWFVNGIPQSLAADIEPLARALSEHLIGDVK
jgi:hypothetical protein